jgi:hypothetical protein
MLEALYGDLEETDWFYIWTLAPSRAKASTWFPGGSDGVASAQAFCAAQSGVNVYWPIAFASAQGSPHERLTIPAVAGIVAVVADIDFKSDTHPHGPDGTAEALTLIDHFPLSPSVTVHSGNGLQCAWLFREPWRFDTDEERAEAQATVRGYAYGLANVAARSSWALDPVHDLTRVMRVPGTQNVKRPEFPLPVSILRIDTGKRYNPQDFEEYCAEVPGPQQAMPLPAVDVSSEFPTEKHQLLCELLPEYQDTWEHRRKALAGKSCSEHDMALTSYTVRANWTDNEITAMLREHRKLHGQDKPAKVNDARYYARTIARARSTLNHDETYQKAGEVLEDPAQDRYERIAALAQRWEVPLQNVQRITGDPPIYRLWIGGKCAEIEAPNLVTQTAFLGQMIAAANLYPRPVGQKEKPGWRDYVNTICQVADEVEAGDSATVSGEFMELIAAFLDGQGIVDVPPGELVNGYAAFRRDGMIWFKPDSLNKFLQHAGYKATRRRVAQMLRAAGAESRLHKTEDSVNGSRPCRFWGVTAKLFGVDE